MSRSLFALVLVCFIAGCGARNQSVSDQAPASVDLSSLPVTLEGRLIADVGEGDVDSEGEESEYSEFNFGTLTVGADEIPVQVSGSVLKSANLSGADEKVRATIGRKSDEAGATYYHITKIERL